MVLLLLKNTLELTFDLDEKHTNQCFFFRGKNLGHEIKLHYELMGSYDNVKFTIIDMNDSDKILSVKNHEQSSNEVSHKINYLHNFMICW